MLSSVASTNFLSWRLAPSTASPTGTPLASVNRLRLAPRLPRSVGFLPVRSPPSGALVIAPSMASHSQSPHPGGDGRRRPGRLPAAPDREVDQDPEDGDHRGRHGQGEVDGETPTPLVRAPTRRQTCHRVLPPTVRSEALHRGPDDAWRRVRAFSLAGRAWKPTVRVSRPSG